VLLERGNCSIAAEMQATIRSPESRSPSSKRKPSHSGSACSLAADFPGWHENNRTEIRMATMKDMTVDEHPLASALEREHWEIDSGIEQYTAADGGDTSPLLRSIAGLRRHIYLEEKFLFPPLRAAGLMMPILVMLREHGDLWRSMDALDALIADGADRTTVVDACRELLAKLDKHNLKEEPIIYPRADNGLTPEAAEELAAFIEAGRMPEGWVCEGAAA
jgi:regulator of cell morphogenesis and NO signaling